MSKNRTIKYDQLTAESFKFVNPGDEVMGEIWGLGIKYIRTEPVPYVQLLDENTQDVVEVLLGTCALEKLYYSQQLKEGRFLAIKFLGESKTIKSANNFLKHFSAYLEDEQGNKIDLKNLDDTGEAAYDLDAPTKEPTEEKIGKSKPKSKSTDIPV